MTNNIDSNLAALAEQAVATLANEMTMARTSKDRQAAANSILDRIGFGRATRVQADVADSEIRNALEAAKAAGAEVVERNAEIQAEMEESIAENSSSDLVEIHENQD